MNLPSSKAYAWWLALLRIATGAIWLSHGIPKFLQSETFMPPNGFIVAFLTKSIADSGGFYHAFLSNEVLPNIGIFAEMVRVGEVLVGCSLVLGLASRLGGLGGAFLALNYIAANHVTSPEAWADLNGTMFALSAINAVLPTGRALGLDGLLGRRAKAPASPVVVAPSAPGIHAEFVEEKPLDGPSAPKT